MPSRKSRKNDPTNRLTNRASSHPESDRVRVPRLAAEWKTHAGVLVVAALLTFGAYANALEGDFVHDDDVQIAKNDNIKHGEPFWQAIATDVWAFKGTSGEARSNYRRPVFVGWMSLNYLDSLVVSWRVVHGTGAHGTGPHRL
jgi:hypothetical protein